jgi:hypothetical protein
MNRKTPLYFGPPLALLTESQNNTLAISGKVNRTAERYLEILRYHGLEVSEPEREYLRRICGVGYLMPEDILDLADEVKFSSLAGEGVDKDALAAKLNSASFADLVAMVESLGL